MDEYRPFPSEPTLEDESEHEDAETGAPQPPLHEMEMEDHDAAGEHPERQAPNLEHPGGHLHGTVARLNRPRRFGFLRTEDGTEVFFHASALEAGPNAYDALRPGQEVEFDCHQDEQGRGLAATLVTITGEPPEPRQPRPPRERPDRAERAEAGERPERAERQRQRRGGDRWRVVVLRERADSSVSSQLERLLNERNVRPGSFTFSLVEGDDAPECWVAYHQDDKK